VHETKKDWRATVGCSCL